MKRHTYDVRVAWTGNTGEGTRTYQSYLRDHVVTVDGKPPLPGSSDRAFRGDPSRYSPEDLLVASLSACHMLWYLHLCAVNRIVVVEYADSAQGYMDQAEDGTAGFVRVVLKPTVTIAPGGDSERARALHHEAHRYCFIARSVKFPVENEPAITFAGP